MNRRVLSILISCFTLGSSAPCVLASSDPKLNFKIYSPDGPVMPEQKKESAAPAKEETLSPAKAVESQSKQEKRQESAENSETAAIGSGSSADTSINASSTNDSGSQTKSAEAASPEAVQKPQQIASKVLQGYIRVVPSGTKLPIIMDTTVDSDTSQEGDEFSARSAEDLAIDGAVVVPAGSIIKGRIAQINPPRNLNRSGSVALKFDTVTTPDNRQIPIVANLVARGGVVHARRGLKDIAIDAGAVALPVAAGLGIGLIAGNAGKKSSVGAGGGALIGAGVGAAVGLAILLSKKGKKVDVRAGDELKIELAEDLRMPMM